MQPYSKKKNAILSFRLNNTLFIPSIPVFKNPSIYYFAVVAASVVSAAVVGSEPSLTVTFSAIYF